MWSTFMVSTCEVNPTPCFSSCMTRHLLGELGVLNTVGVNIKGSPLNMVNELSFAFSPFIDTSTILARPFLLQKSKAPVHWKTPDTGSSLHAAMSLAVLSVNGK